MKQRREAPVSQDDSWRQVRPWATYALVTATAWVYAWQLALGPEGARQAMFTLGLIPAVMTRHATIEAPLLALSPPITLVTTLFLHRDSLALALSLSVMALCGATVERALGTRRYCIFYLACGVFCGLVQVVVAPNARLPLIGAGGAAAGILGAFLLLRPGARWNPLALALPDMPGARAGIAAACWFALAIVHGASAVEPRLAWFVLPAGFVAGGCLLLLLKRREVPLLR